MEPLYIRKHDESSRHRKEVKAAGFIGCFFCLQISDATAIEDWIDDGDTALCPKCGIDSVIPVKNATYLKLLKQMNHYWFKDVPNDGTK